MDTSKTYLITGGSGFLGHSLIKELLKRGVENIRVVARNEGKLVELKNKFPSVDILTGDIGDSFVCERACRDVQGIFHLAAFKHVGLAENNTKECTKSNVEGTINLLEETRKNKPEFIIGISSDKAASAGGIYGATKMIMERLFSEYEITNPDTKYRIVRYGNVLYSTGSVLCKWKDLLEKGEEVIVTDLEATRFYWTVEEAIDLIFKCLEKSNDSTPMVVPMKAMRIGDLLQAMVQKYLPKGVLLRMKEIGLQPGENKHEIVVKGGKSSAQVERYTTEEIVKMI